MSNTPQQPHLGQLPQMFAQYSQSIELLNNNLTVIRRNLERTDISDKEREQLQKQEQDFQTKLTTLQTLLNNLTPQLVAQNLQQRVLMSQQQQQQQSMGSPAPHADTMGIPSNPGSPASFNPQQQQQQPPLPFNAGQLAAQALAAQQQQLRNVQQQQTQQQQQQVLNKLGLAANTAMNQNTVTPTSTVNTASNTASPQTANFASPMMQPSPNNSTMQMKATNTGVPNTTPSTAATTNTTNAGKNNNNATMFTFSSSTSSSHPSQQQQQQQQQLQQTTAPLSGPTVTTTPGGSTAVAPPSSNNNNNNTLAPTPLKPASAPSLDSDGVHRVLTKRKIQELVSQIDPAERLEPEVEDILLEIADEFIESVTTFACQLAKHRKSNTLEVKDVQLHLERNWNIRIPGFAADDIRPLRKTNTSSSHQAKVQAVNTAKSQPSKKDQHHHTSSNM
ncbi:transcription initiation factor TFIID subunit A-domain-containing protein [Mycotypha africana]|uniref:transcription initiation factor TFIID subunit A-domain-containing protein n=1 Tax=Mycotypha africana TaxID=64632 RepID=UPI00230095D9|nr:transcription initiation factor TFIID subunit A-domain-containing protein [Mycotypha africana]KAI8968867.1 transcription initiation factor TFIID subunit A-domain-containing protein [Mycotypha africana]